MAKKKQNGVQKLPISHITTEWIFQFWAWQLLAWMLYRYFLKFPEWIDEFIVKPMVFVLPVLWYLSKREHSRLASVGITKKNFWKNFAIGCAVGFVFMIEGFVISILKHHGFQFPVIVTSYSFISILFLSLATSISEEILFRGFFFSRLLTQTKKVWYSVIVSTLLFMAFHIPVLVTSLNLQGTSLVLFFWTTMVIGIVNSIFYYTSESLVTPVLVHFFWNVTATLFL